MFSLRTSWPDFSAAQMSRLTLLQECAGRGKKTQRNQSTAPQPGKQLINRLTSEGPETSHCMLLIIVSV